MNLPIRRPRRVRPPNLALPLAFVLAAVSTAAAVTLFLAAQNASRWVQHTLAVELKLDAAQILTMRAEIFRRGYVLTGDPAQRAASLKAQAMLRLSLGELQAFVSDNPRQRRNVTWFRQVAGERVADMAAAIRLRDRGEPVRAAALTSAPSSRAGIASVIQAQQNVRDEERSLLVGRQARARQMERWGTVAFGGSSLVLALLAIIVWRERRLRLAELLEANHDLSLDIALREQAEARLEMLATNATDAVLRIGSDGVCLYASPSAQDVMGLAPIELVGRRLHTLVFPADRTSVAECLQRLLEGRETRALITCRAKRTSDVADQRWLEASCKAVGDSGHDSLREVIASVRDVTRRKELELQLEAARVHAEEAAAAKARFLANMSHDIRTPMNGVLGFTDVVLAGELPAEQRRHVELIAESGRSMMRLLNDILDLSKIEAGAMHIVRDTVDLRHILKRCVGLMTPMAEQKGLAVRTSIDPALPAQIVGDPLRLRQILLNLIGNAVKFTETGEITVGAQMAGDRLRISVRDTGIGIAPDRLQEVFHQFTQAEGSIAQRFGGSGLGLSISGDLAQLMGGAITVDSDPGRGSTFTLDLPLEEAASKGERRSTPLLAVAPALKRAARILVAEDHDINQELVTAMVRRAGAEPTIAPDGAAAVAAIRTAIDEGTPFDIVLMDMQMPVMDGLEATRRIRAMGIGAERLPIVALTANAFAEDVQASLDAGMQAHLAKPIRIDELHATIARFVDAGEAEPTPAEPARQMNPRLVERYRERKAAARALLERLVAADRVDPAAIAEAADLLHKLAGVAAMFGDATVGEWARELEHWLPQWTGDAAALRQAIERFDQAA